MTVLHFMNTIITITIDPRRLFLFFFLGGGAGGGLHEVSVLAANLKTK